MSNTAFQTSSSYGWTNFPPGEFERRMQFACEKLIEVRKKRLFDAIAFSGASGQALGYIAGVVLRVPVMYVRKEDERCHGWKVECNSTKPIDSYIIVDDFTSSGSTVAHIIDSIDSLAFRNEQKLAKCVGVLLYDYCGKPRTVKVGKVRYPIFNARMPGPVDSDDDDSWFE